MAGIQQLEIHSKSYIVRWAKVPDGHTISWSVQPYKKSVNFGIVKHPGQGVTSLGHSHDGMTSAASVPDGPSDDGLGGGERNSHSGSGSKARRFTRGASSTAQDQLRNKGFLMIDWYGKCEADKQSVGTHDVPAGQGGMYGLVFDNTFSKQTSKTATFVCQTYPTDKPPKGQQPDSKVVVQNQPGLAGSISRGVEGPSQANNESKVSLHSRDQRATSLNGRSDGSGAQTSTTAAPALTYHTGMLLKRRRKKGQGYARRYFSLDFSTCTLAYYYNRNSSALRGAIPLSLAAVAADERHREVSIDSGAEIWHLRASNAKDFSEWARALEKASRIGRGLEPEIGVAPQSEASASDAFLDPGSRNPPGLATMQRGGDYEWEKVESLVSRIAGTRDALRRLVKEMAAQKQQQQLPQLQQQQQHQQNQTSRPQSSYSHLTTGTPTADDHEGYFGTSHAPERKSFWRRKSNAASPISSQVFHSTVASSLAIPTPGSATSLAINTNGNQGKAPTSDQQEKSMHDHCAAILNDLDMAVGEFSAVIAQTKKRRTLTPSPHDLTSTRKSLESTGSLDEFFDAEAGDTESRTQVVMINQQHSEGSHPPSDAEEASIHSSSSASSVADDEAPLDAKGIAALFPTKTKSLAPLPVDIGVDRRKTIPPATVAPPSLIAFVRKNVGKDLSTISMPVSANEPTSLLHRVAEQLEYAQLLDQAAQQKSPLARLQHVAAFAVSHFSINRAKERSIRKPFNPLLGETFELLRTESEVPGSFRLVVEKVTHRPLVRLALQADASSWSFAQSPAPTQKFWGKSAEINTEGPVRIVLRLPDGNEERYSYNIATMFLRNVVMGEKYVEPVGDMTLLNDSTGDRATVEFRSKGMFGGRGEEVHVKFASGDGSSHGSGADLAGTWTNALKCGRNEIWRVGHLVPNAPNVYGLTGFAASLNEITPIEKGRLPPTDTRLRPDQRLAEQGKLEEAEAEKVRLEEAQRVRRREMEEKGEEWCPRWFGKVTVGEEEVWKLKGGRDGYWECRERGFEGVEGIF